MQPHIIAEMAAIEEDHWWYAGLRDLYRRLLAQPRFAPPLRPRVLDAGCGTGAMLRFLQQQLQPAYLGGFDRNAFCVASSRKKCPEADVYAADFGVPTFAEREYDLIVSSEVISYVEPEPRREGLRRLAERLSPGGRLLLHVPACPWLFSRHDRAVGTRYRFTADDVRRAIADAGLQIELLSYRISLLFPAVAAQRLLSRGVREEKRSDLAQSTGFAGSVCRRITSLENAALCRGVRMPIGSSLVCVARRATLGEGGRRPDEGTRPDAGLRT